MRSNKTQFTSLGLKYLGWVVLFPEKNEQKMKNAKLELVLYNEIELYTFVMSIL